MPPVCKPPSPATRQGIALFTPDLTSTGTDCLRPFPTGPPSGNDLPAATLIFPNTQTLASQTSDTVVPNGRRRTWYCGREPLNAMKHFLARRTANSTDARRAVLTTIDPISTRPDLDPWFPDSTRRSRPMAPVLGAVHHGILPGFCYNFGRPNTQPSFEPPWRSPQPFLPLN